MKISGAGVTLNPVAFLVITDNNVKLLPVNYSSPIDKLLDYIPELIEKTEEICGKKTGKINIKTEYAPNKQKEEIQYQDE